MTALSISINCLFALIVGLICKAFLTYLGFLDKEASFVRRLIAGVAIPIEVLIGLIGIVWLFAPFSDATDAIIVLLGFSLVSPAGVISLFAAFLAAAAVAFVATTVVVTATLYFANKSAA